MCLKNVFRRHLPNFHKENNRLKNMLKAGSGFTNITPKKPHFLHGYPFAERMSTGVNDWLLSSSLYLTDGIESVIFITNDILYVNKSVVFNVRKAVSEATGVSAGNIMIGATHTHSGPVIVDCVISINDKIVPPADPEYIRYLEQQMIHSACKAFNNAKPAKIGLAVADGTGIGTNRRAPDGPVDLDIPVLAVKDLKDEWIACMLVCSMHPTVLHEDSTLYSGDFPAYAREILQKRVFGYECPVLHFTGAAGNQSPRHVTQSNTFDEAARIGKIIVDAVKKKLDAGMKYFPSAEISCRQELIDLPRRILPDVEWATSNKNQALDRFNALKKTSCNLQEIRTAEVDWFGAEELLFLSQQSAKGALEEVYRTCLPAEIQIIKIGEWSYVSFPGEVFVEYALELKRKFADTFLMTLTNGELQGYIVTEEAVQKNYYEASNSLFHYSSGELLLSKTFEMLK
jgi:hypothetical protein